MLFLVVFGHLLECFSSTAGDNVYRVIYSFHIPVLIFISGYFARFNRWKIISSLIYPYILFQVFYICFEGQLYGIPDIEIQFSTPTWLLWYLMALIWYYLLIPFIDSRRLFIRGSVIAGAVLLSVLAGFFTDIGYFMTLARFFTFWPYFIAGYYLGHPIDVSDASIHKLFQKRFFRNAARIISVCLVCLLTLVVRYGTRFSKRVLYGSYPYKNAEYTPSTKIMLLLIGLIWIVFLLTVIPNVKIPLMSSIGGASLPVFLMHGFCVRLLNHYKFFSYSTLENILLALVISFGILLLFGNPVSAFLCRRLCTGWWMETIVKKLRTSKKTPDNILGKAI